MTNEYALEAAGQSPQKHSGGAPWNGLIKQWRFLLAAAFALASACAIPVSYQDATTYRNLTDLKAEMMTLVENFDAIPYARSEPRIDQLRLALRKAHEYELGKGESNSDTVKQFNAIRKLFEETVGEYRGTRPGELGKKYFHEAAKVIGQAFDIAIATENAKNKATGTP